MIDIDFASLRRIGFTQTLASQLHLLPETPADARLARITEIQRDWLTMHDGHDEFRARVLRSVHDATPAVGDWALSTTLGHEHWLCAVVPPVTHIARRGHDGRHHSLVSNVDTALLVMGLDKDFNPRRLERYLAIVKTANVEPVVVLSKADVATDTQQRMALLRDRLPRNIALLAVNTLSDSVVTQLAPWLGAGQTLVLLGSSGAGKSSLTNTLAQAGQHTGSVRDSDHRGRHTTTSRSLHRCASGACIIDTPGLRSWQPDADQASIAASFDDIEALASQCQFRDCRHATEPGCAVRGVVDADRLHNYHKLLREARRSEQTPLDRVAEVAKWKVLHRAAQARVREKKGEV
ncbi:ribosome small subunit-dependent GTPase A [Duganella sp. P38]|uniref:ribosome small subunit-dependent GTPase A n=1 Tax=Duganella sp. P38 TaxID=3423949 RepID=UPI003D7929A5